MHARDVRRLTISEYVALDRTSDERWEYANGEAWATRGASPEHAIVVRNVVVQLANALEGRPCRVLPDGQKIATPRTGGYHCNRSGRREVGSFRSLTGGGSTR